MIGINKRKNRVTCFFFYHFSISLSFLIISKSILFLFSIKLALVYIIFIPSWNFINHYLLFVEIIPKQLPISPNIMLRTILETPMLNIILLASGSIKNGSDDVAIVFI